MSDWQDFEQRAFRFLRRRYSNGGTIDFVQEGASNSNVLDVKVVGQNCGEINIEVKSPVAQSGQFVMTRENGLFNFKPNRQYAQASVLQQKLIDYINEELDLEEVTQTAQVIPYSNQDAAELVKEHYDRKNASFFVTSNLEDPQDFVIIPLESLEEAFNFQINLRRKKSGTRSIPASEREAGESLAVSKLNELGISLKNTEVSGSKFLVRTNCEYKVDRKDSYFSEPHGDYFFAQVKDDLSTFEIKKRSRTNNINVVYGCEYNGVKNNSWQVQFEQVLSHL